MAQSTRGPRRKPSHALCYAPADRFDHIDNAERGLPATASPAQWVLQGVLHVAALRHEARGDRDAGRTYADRLLELAPHHDGAIAIKRRLGDL